MIILFGIGCGSAVLCLGWIATSLTVITHCIIYSIGSSLLCLCCQNGKQFSWALCTKLPAPPQKLYAMAAIMIGYFGARGVGAFVAPSMNPNSFSLVSMAFLVSNVVLVVVFGNTYMDPTPKPNPM